MRDVIWTVIAIWLIYKLVDIFKNSGSKRSPVQDTAAPPKGSAHLHKDVRSAARKSADSEGEYVDYEEVK